MRKLIKFQSFLMSMIIVVLTCFSATFIKTQAASITTAYIEGEGVGVRETPSSKNDDNLIERVSNISATVLEQVTVKVSVDDEKTSSKNESSNKNESSDKESSKNQKEEIWLKVSYVKDGKTKKGYVFYNPDYIRLVTYDPDASFEKKIEAFPESYRDSLRILHAEYPKWEFIPDPVNSSFSSAVADQLTNNRKLVQLSYHPVSWRSMGLGAYDWNTEKWTNIEGGWTGASKEIISYYMDPRNFLNSDAIYMFMEQSYNASVQNRAGVKKIIKDTFMEKNYTPAKDEPGQGYYVNIIMRAAEKSGVSPYIIASKIKQEQGVKGTSDLISGKVSEYKGYYNFFNVGATGGSESAVIKNGLKYAKANGWDSRYKSVLGGSKFLAANYISRGQSTYFYQDFNVHNGGTHQYAQAVNDAYSKGLSLANTYKEDKEFSLSFIIPVYTNMPTKAYAKPEWSDKKNNYYLKTLKVEGLTPSFSMYVHKYNLEVSKDTAIKVRAIDDAKIVSEKEFKLQKGENRIKIRVQAESGNTDVYILDVSASKKCTIYLNSSGIIPEKTESSSKDESKDESKNSSKEESKENSKDESKENSKDESKDSSKDQSSDNSKENSKDESKEETIDDEILIGDVNANSKIDIIDLAAIKLHLLNVKGKELKDNAYIAADVNKDKKISIVDLAAVKMHLLGKKIIEQ